MAGPYQNNGSYQGYNAYQLNGFGGYQPNQTQIQTPYPYQATQVPQAVKSDDAAKIVQTVAEAENYPLAPMQTVYFIAMNDSALCIKSTDPVREPFVIYDMMKRNAEQPKEYVTKEEFNELKKTIDELLK